MKLSEELEKRGFIHQHTSESVADITDGESRTVYLGIDPSGDSAHVGHLVTWLLLRHLLAGGHKVIFLVGGGTGMIGDPKPDVERPLTPPEVVNERVEKLSMQAKRILGSEEITFVNNHDWLGQLNLIDFLRDTGKHFTVNELIKKDAIATRLESEIGLSYTEFAYPLLQAYDYLQLHEQHGCDLQIGGSDQWGNIVAGVDLVRRKTAHEAHAITVPLVIDKATGKKFGKSEGNAVWLDPTQTSPYQFYQFWLNVSDESVIDYLKLYTTLTLEEIATIEQEFPMNPGARAAQKTLALAVTTLVHGDDAARNAKAVSNILFGDITKIISISQAEIDMLIDSTPHKNVSGNELVVDLLVETNLATSKREAKTFIESGAVSINDHTIDSVEATIEGIAFMGSVAVLRRGKKQLSVLVKEM
ncbi:MAG: tyrosine--tRNA ligase [Patescibacteria group bacterium]